MNNEKNEGQVGKVTKAAQKSCFVDVICTPVGSPISPVYKRVYDEKLKKSIVKKVDETNIDEFIQASKSQTDLAVLQKRFLELGEIPSVDSTLGSNDLTLFPSDIHGVYDMVNNVSDNFNKLPESVRQIFGDSETYLKSLLDGTYQATLVNAFNSKKTEVKAEDKKEGNE